MEPLLQDLLLSLLMLPGALISCFIAYKCYLEQRQHESILSKMKLDIHLSGVSAEKGYRVLDNNGVILIGISPANTYFDKDTINQLIHFSTDVCSKVYVLYPHQIYEHNYKALKYSARKIKKQTKDLLLKKEIIKEVLNNIDYNDQVHLIDWNEEIETSIDYQDYLEYLEDLYTDNSEFQNDVNEAVSQVLSKKNKNLNNKMLSEGSNYILKEFALFLALPAIVGTNDIAFVYHKEWSIWNKFSNGDYNNIIPVIGFVKISMDHYSLQQDIFSKLKYIASYLRSEYANLRSEYAYEPFTMG